MLQEGGQNGRTRQLFLKGGEISNPSKRDVKTC